MTVSKLTRLALLTGMALSLFVIEMQIPLPIALPGVKLGLANIITVYAIYYFSKKEVFLMVLTKVIVGSIFSGQILTIIYSFTGSMFCLLAMFALKNIITIKQLWLLSICGALFHNLGQIIIAVLIMNSLVMFIYLPFLILIGTFTGLFTGLCAQMIINHIDKKANLMIKYLD